MTSSSSKSVFEAQLKQVKAFRGSTDVAEYMHVVLGLIFLKYISDAKGDGADYRAWARVKVPQEARWSHLMDQAKQRDIGQIVDDAMEAVERDNLPLRGVLLKDYDRSEIDNESLGQIIDLVSNVDFGDLEAAHSNDILGRMYEYFLSRFAGTEGNKDGEFYTPSSVVRLLVEMIGPYTGSVYDPCCGSSGMFVQSVDFIEAHAIGNGGPAQAEVSIYGQELNEVSWRLAKMNLAIRGIDGQIACGDSLHNDMFPDLKVDYILANPPFNIKKWGGDRLRDDARWKYGVPPVKNANFAWVQHIIHHLAPTGTAGMVLANGSMSNQSGEGEIRRAIVEADLVDCMVALPGRLFYSTQIPVCLWLLARDKRNGRFRDRRGETLFIDAQKLGVHRELTDDDIAKIAGTYHAWRGDKDCEQAYEDVPGFCKAAALDDIRGNGHVLTPGRYVGAAEAQENDDEPFDKKMARLTARLWDQMAEGQDLDAAIKTNLMGLGYDE